MAKGKGGLSAMLKQLEGEGGEEDAKGEKKSKRKMKRGAKGSARRSKRG